MHFGNQTVCSKTHSWSYERWRPSRNDESPSRTKAESELACAAKKCLLAAISAGVQLWWTSAEAVTRWSPGKQFILAAGSSPTPVGSGGYSLRQPGRRRGESHRRKRHERQRQVGFSLWSYPKKKSNAPMSVKSEIVTDYKSLNYLNAPWNKNVFFRRWSRDWAWIYF